MSLIANYQEISLAEWQQTAQAACFSTNQELKSRAQQFFYMFMQAPKLRTYLDLINNGSDTLLFVLFSCTSKNTEFFGKNIDNLSFLVKNILTWELNGFTFTRQSRVPLQEYVTRTIMHTLGALLKALYKSGQTQKLIQNLLCQLPDNYFKLYIFRSFIESIETIDYDMGYMKHRSMIYHFQDQIIPFICDVLMPFFYKIQENLQVNELSYLQQQLRVNQNQQLQQQFNRKLTLLSRDQEIQASYILQLLKSVIQFSYNISYTEYQHESAAETTLISFPEKVLKKIINGQFIKAYFFVLEKIASLNTVDKKLDYLLAGLGCLSKMMQSRLSALEQQGKQFYILECMKGMTKIMAICIEIGTHNVMQAILCCNNKLLTGCQFSFIKATIQKHLGNLQVYYTYIKDLTSVVVQIIAIESVSYQNNLLFTTLETANKILINFGCRDDENIQQEGSFFINFEKAVVDNYLNNLCSPRRIFASSSLININDNKSIISHLFQSFKRLGTYDYEYLFSKLEQKVDNFIANMSEELIVVANILFLLSEIVDKHFLERTPFLHMATRKDISILARTVNKCTHLMKCYMNTRTVYFKKEATYIDLAVILFSQAMAMQFLSNFEGNLGIKITHPLYCLMINGADEIQMRAPKPDSKSEEVLLQYLNVLLKFLEGCLIANKQDETKMLYVLQVIEKSIFKLKWHSKREVYLQTQTFHALESFVSRFFNQFSFMLSIRTRTAKLLVTLNFDDALDEYKFRICRFINIVKVQKLPCILYDLIGAFQGIEALVICKYFYNRLKKEIDLKIFFDSIFELAFKERNEILFKDICRLIRVMVNNKGLKLSICNPTSYEIFTLILPHLILITNQIRLGSDLDFWSDSLCEIVEMMNYILNGTHINVFMMENLTQVSANGQAQPLSSAMKQFLSNLFSVISGLTPSQVKVYPKLEELVIMFYSSVNRQLLAYILQDSGERFVLQFTIFYFRLVDLIVEFMKEILEGGKSREDILIRSLEAAKNFYTFAKQKSQFIHKTTLINNLQKIFCAFANSEVNESKHQILIFYSLSFILTNYKNNLSILKPIGKILYWTCNFFFRESLIESLVKLKISPFMVGEFDDILNKQKLSEDGFMEQFRHWVRRSDQY